MSADRSNESWRPTSWYTGPPHQRSEGVNYGRYDWPSRCEWYVPGTWPGAWESVAESASENKNGSKA